MRTHKLTAWQLQGQTAALDFAGLKATVQAVAPGIIRVHRKLDGVIRHSHAIEGDKTQPTELRAEQKDDGLWLHTQEVSVRIGDGFYVDFFDNTGSPVCLDYRGERSPLERVSPEYARLLESEGHEAQSNSEHTFEVVKALDQSAHFYGLGDKTGFLDKRHYDYEMWNTDNPAPHVDCFKALYKSVPFFICLFDDHVYGIFLDNTFKSYFNMGQESQDYYWFGSDGGDLDYYYIAGTSIAQVLERYTYLTGTCPLPQKWTLGYHQCRWGYVTQGDMEQVVNGMRENDIPMDALHFDIDYMDNYKVFTWNDGRYHGDPAGFLRRLAGLGIKPVSIIDPGVKKEAGYHVYEEGVANGYFAKDPQGQVYINRVWPGESAFPDFGNPQVRRWWGDQHQFLLDMGVRGVWNDMNEPASFDGPLPDDVVFTDEGRTTDHTEVHNIYGHLMAKATYEGMKKLDGKRPFVITRACYAGSQKYTTVWTGDNCSLWAHLQMAIPQLCNLGLSGMPFAGTDIGGFGADTTAELLTRWIQVGCFSPLCRNHAALGTRRQEPWHFGQETVDIYRKYVKLRYHLLPYFYDLFHQSAETGAPVMRPLVYHFEKDETARVCHDEFMLGSQILVAPVVHQGAKRRMVYLPEGQWYDYWTREQLTGPVWFIREAPLDTCPIYVRAGSVIPVAPPQSYVGQDPGETLLLDVYPGDGTWEHYTDNGEDFAYEQGKYDLYRFTVTKDGNVAGLCLHRGYEKPYKTIRTLDGKQIPVESF